MPMRMTGINSGLDTETIIQELVAARRTKVDKLTKEQTKLEWKQDVWKGLNDKIKKFFNGTLSNLRYESSFMKKTTKVSNANLVSIETEGTAMDSVQELKIKKMAKAGYLTGGKITNAGGEETKVTSGSKVTAALGIAAGSKFEVNVGGKTTDIEIDENTTISNLVSKLQAAGVKANFDAANQRFFIGADGTGAAKDFTLTASNAEGMQALKQLGLLVDDTDENGNSKTLAAYEKYAYMSAEDKDSAVNARAAALLKSYQAEKDSLEKDIENINERQDTIAKVFAEGGDYYVEGSTFDITDVGNRSSRKTALEESIKDLEKELEDDTLSDERKADLNNQLNRAKGELSYIDGYEKNADSLKEKEDRLNVLNGEGYLGKTDVDGKVIAGAQIQEEAEAYVQGKIDNANAVLNGAMSFSEGAVKVSGQDAEISLNGATFTSSTNTLKVNGLTITCKGVTQGDEVITLTTENDTSGIYDMIKGFIKEYSELINEMDKLYNAESAKDYEPLTDEEKEDMSEKEIEKWESKIKDSLLRRDSTLNSVSSAMKEIMASGFSVGGKTMYLSDFGIETLGYFNAADNEKNAYHINGDEDDDEVKAKDNVLKQMISSDPDSVVKFFTALSKSLNSKLSDLMAGNAYSSSFTVYDDKKMKEDYEGYKTKISDAEKKLNAYEDKWYKKFSAMETALAKMQSNANAITGLLGQ